MHGARSAILGIVGAAWLIIGWGGGCGYGFQGTHNPLKDKHGVQRVYVAPVGNASFKAGVENLVYNQVVKRLAAGGRLTLVSRREEADAVLTGTVGVADYGPSASTTADKLFPIGRGSADTAVASAFTASLSCSFYLNRRMAKEGETGEKLWSSDISRAKAFPGNSQFGAFGTTSPLINDSEFDRALGDLAESVASDLQESLLAMF